MAFEHVIIWLLITEFFFQRWRHYFDAPQLLLLKGWTLVNQLAWIKWRPFWLRDVCVLSILLLAIIEKYNLTSFWVLDLFTHVSHSLLVSRHDFYIRFTFTWGQRWLRIQLIWFYRQRCQHIIIGSIGWSYFIWDISYIKTGQSSLAHPLLIILLIK
jgi:hypothetical protein